MIKKTPTSLRSIWLGIFVLLLTNLAMAQGRTFTGKVTDQKTGIEVSDLTVQVKGTTIDITTGAEGSYGIRLSQNATTIHFSHGCLGAQKLPVGASISINVLLQSNVDDGGYEYNCLHSIYCHSV